MAINESCHELKEIATPTELSQLRATRSMVDGCVRGALANGTTFETGPGEDGSTKGRDALPIRFGIGITFESVGI